MKPLSEERLATPPEAPLFPTTGDPTRDLERAAEALVQMAFSPEVLAWGRMMDGEARRRPELGRLFYACGAERVLTAIASLLDRLAAGGHLDISDVRLAAELFFGMTVGLPLLRSQHCGVDPLRSAGPR